jgi:hypothetical protein
LQAPARDMEAFRALRQRYFFDRCACV